MVGSWDGHHGSSNSASIRFPAARRAAQAGSLLLFLVFLIYRAAASPLVRLIRFVRYSSNHRLLA
jgi:hypothetical protein